MVERSLRRQLDEIVERVKDLPDRVRVGARVANQSGLVWEVTMPGLRAILRGVAGGAPNPALVFRIHASNTPNKVAIRWRDRAYTFAEFDDSLDRLALGMQERGIRRGSSVVLMLRNRPEFMQASSAAARIGVAAVSVSWRSTPSELAYLAGHSGARAIFFEHDLWPTVERAHRELPHIARRDLVAVGGDVAGQPRFEELVAPSRAGFVQDRGVEEDAAVVVYTSGTTGKPKGAVRKFPKDSLPAAMRFIAQTPMRCDDVHLVTCPLYHSTAFGFMALTFILGGTCVIMDEFKPEHFLHDVESRGITSTAVVPTMLHRILQLGPAEIARHDTRSLRCVFSGGAPLSGRLAVEFMDQFGDILYNFYGATETGLVTLAGPTDLRAAPGTIGHAVPGNEIRLLDDAGREVGEGKVGELYAKNKLLVEGYHRDAEATRASMRDGFFSVGDLARRDREGRYFIEGRRRDMIISGGVNVYPAEVETVLDAHPDVAECAVVGVDDPEWGERVRAFIVRKPGATGGSELEGSLKLWCKERLAGPKVPRDYVVLDALPRNPTGKVLKRDLKALKFSA